jgi:tripartite-type tricarboxylate transporter receptor subunit TctC
VIRTIMAILLLAGAVNAASAQSEAAVAQWPDRPIRFIVPFPAGAATDVVARIVAQRMGARLGQTVVVENRVGASGNIGADAVAKAAPDGYTIGFATATTHPIAASLSPHLSYDPVKDFSPVSMLGSTPYSLVAWNGLPVKTVADLIAYAKANPGKLGYSSVGPASLAHLAAQLFATTVGVELTHVPYKSASQAVFDLMEGRIQIQFGLVAASLGQVRDGKLTAIAVTSAERVPDLPGVPTIAESGLPGYEATLWTAVVMPPGVPPAIVNKLHDVIAATLKEPEIEAALQAKGFIVGSSTPDQLRTRIEQDIRKWRDLAVKAKINIQ